MTANLKKTGITKLLTSVCLVNKQKYRWVIRTLPSVWLHPVWISTLNPHQVLYCDNASIYCVQLQTNRI